MCTMYYITHNHHTSYAKKSFIVQTMRLISDIIKRCQDINIPCSAVALIDYKKLSTAMHVCFHPGH